MHGYRGGLTIFDLEADTNFGGPVWSKPVLFHTPQESGHLTLKANRQLSTAIDRHMQDFAGLLTVPIAADIALFLLVCHLQPGRG